MPAFPVCLLVARYGSLVVAIVALSVASFSLDVDLASNAHAQIDHAKPANTSPQLADRWRRTAQGWEQLSPSGRSAVVSEAPTQHVTLVQAWPAAWAACVVLSILGLAATGAERKEIDACLASGDQFGYDLGRAA